MLQWIISYMRHFARTRYICSINSQTWNCWSMVICVCNLDTYCLIVLCRGCNNWTPTSNGWVWLFPYSLANKMCYRKFFFFCQFDRWKIVSYYSSNLDILLFTRCTPGRWRMRCSVREWRISQSQAVKAGCKDLTLFALICGHLAQGETLTAAGPIQVISGSEGTWKSHTSLSLPMDGLGGALGVSA